MPIKRYNGSDWEVVAGAGVQGPQGATGASATTVVTTKGDLLSYSTTAARLAVGNNGETLVADSSTSTGLRYQADFAAGKNKIINGDFGVWQRGTTFTNPSSVYTADRYLCTIDGGTGQTITRQTFTPGTAPVSGYEGSYYQRFSMSSGSTFWSAAQKVEDVRVFAGQSVTFSFWAKASTAFTAGVLLRQNFGSGGSSDVDLTTTVSVTTSWQRFSFSTTLGAMTGKTIGTNSNLQCWLYHNTGTVASNVVDTWGWQLEAGSVATAFQTATGTIQGELAACQRYYWRSGGNIIFQRYGNGSARSTNQVDTVVNFPVTMRTTPTSLDYSNIAVYDGSTITATTAIALDQTSPMFGALLVTVASGLTQFRPYSLLSNNTLSAYLGFNAEL
jgi:hypothetical protein